VSELLQGAQGELHLPAVRDDRVPQAELLCGERLLRGGSGESSLDGALIKFEYDLIPACVSSKQHTLSCGGGIGIFLVVTSTYIIVIRGRRACLWGSLYLDDFDEEDRDLK